MSKDYSSIIDEVYRESEDAKAQMRYAQYKASLMTSLPVSPEQATKQYQLSKQTGIPVGIVRAKENEIAQRTELATFEDSDFVNNFPKVVAQLSRPEVAGAIKDDINSLSTFEKISRSTQEKFQQSALQDETVDLRLRRMGFEATGNEKYKLRPSEEALISEFDRAQPRNYDLSFISRVIPETASALRNVYGVAKRAGSLALAGTGIGAGIGAAVGALSPTKAVPQAAGVGARIGLTYTGGAASGYEMAKLEAAGAYDELRNVVDETGKPLEKDVAAGAAMMTGAINGAIELLPAKIGFDTVKKAFSREGVKELVKNPIAREYLKNIGKGMLAEGSTEALQSLIGIIVGEGAKIKSDGNYKPFGMKDLNDIEGFGRFFSEKVAPEVKESFIAGSAGGAGISASGGVIIAAKRIYDNKKANEREQEAITQIIDTSKQSKVLQRDSALFKDVTESTLGETNIYIPAEQIQTYFQEKPDQAASFFRNIPDAQEQIQEALDTGGNLVIKGNDLATAIKENPELETLKEFMKLSPESFNALEAQDEFLTRVVPEQVALEEEAISNAERDAIKRNIRQQISNVIPTKEQEDYIKLLESYYDTRAKKYGSEAAKKILETYLGQLEIGQKKFQKPSPFKMVEDLDLMIDKARKPIKQPKPSKPLLRTLKEMGGVKLGSNLAGELNAMGVNSKTAPSLFRKESGLGDIDNIPLSEFQTKFPNVQAIADETGNYVDRNYLLNLLSEEQFGKDITQVRTPEQEQIDNFLQGLDEAGIDLNASNEEIKKAIKEYQGRDNTYFQSAPTFYSALEKQITDLPQGKGSPEQWAGIIKNLTQKGVKQEELDWTGIEDWIKEQKGSVTKEQILDYLKANKIEVEEVVKGDYPKQLQDLYKQLEEKNNGKEFDDWKVEDQDEWIKKRGEPANTKFSKYTLAGGENYRELLMTLPIQKRLDDVARLRYLRDQGKERAYTPNERIEVMDLQERLDEAPELYKSSHYDEPNILAHIRFNERTDKDGNKVMFVEEIQSDWHQEGRKKGYKKSEQELKKLKGYEFAKEQDRINKLWANEKATNEELDKLQASLDEKIKNSDVSEEDLRIARSEITTITKIPNAPFKTTWNELAFKRALLWAVENGFDKVAWTTGEMQAERYDLSKQLNKVMYWSMPDGKYGFSAFAKGSDSEVPTIKKNNLTPVELEDNLGKEITQKIINKENPTEKVGDTQYGELSGLDLKVGGEGMKGFYDKILPTAVNKLVKKFGGKVEQTEIGAGKVWSLDITPAMQETISKQGLPLFQNASSPKGQTQFIGQKPVITLFEKADRSTLLHELGHTFLQIEADVAKLPDMPADFKKDWATLEKWLGVKDGIITREAHEKFARGFEAYVREGKAPSLELRSAFRRFKAWLVKVYQDVLNLNVKLNDDIRGYFDRLFATDEAIETQRNNPIFATDKNVLELLTKKEREDYIKISDNAKEKTKEQLLKKAFKQSELKNKKSYKEALEEVKQEIQDELNQDKTFKVLNYLKTGKLNGEEQPKKIKLSRQDVKENYDGEFIKYLPKEIFGKDGVEVALVADEFGFKSGSEMLYSIANAPDYKARVEELADQEMIRRYGDMLKDGTIEREALEMAENEARANKIVYELNAVNRKVRTITETKDAYKQKAKEIIEGKGIVEATDTNKYYINELKTAREAGKALGKKDYEKAVDWKKKQLLNHFLFRESKALRDEIKASKKRYDRYKKKPAKGKVVIDEDYRLRISNLLQDFGLANKGIDYVQTNIQELDAWKKGKQEEGVLGLIEFPEIADFQGKSFNQLTVEEYRTLDNAIENLAHIGRQERSIIVDGVKKSIDEFVDSVQENLNKLPDKQVKIGELSKKEKYKKFFDSAVTFLDKVQTTVFKIDDKKELGVFYQGFVKGLTEGERNKDNLSRESYAKLDEIFKKHYKKGVIPSKETYFETLGQSLTKNSVIALALNWGNETNRKRIKDGYKWTDQQVNEILTTLDKNDLAFVQDIWDFINSYWSTLESIDKKIYGIAAKKEAASPITINTKDGKVDLKGGYYPISYTEDTDFLETPAKELKSFFVNNQGSNLNINKSYSNERAAGKVQGKVNLTLSPLFQHLEDVINDIALKEPAWNAYKLVKNNKLKTQLKKKIGNADYQSLVSWVKDVYGRTSVQEGYLNKLARRARGATVMYQMGFKLCTAIIQATGFLNSTVKLGYGNMSYGIWKALGNGNPISINKAIREAEAKSKILKNRAKSFNRDVSEIMQRMERSKGLMPDIAKYAFLAITSAQKMVDVPTWYGAYYKGFKEFKDDAKAVEYADKILESTQGTSHKYALSAIERNESGFARIMTTFYSYVNVKLALLRQSYIGTDFKKPKDVAKFVNDVTLLFIADAIATEFLRQGISEILKDEDDEEEDKKKLTLKYLNLVGQSIVAPIPGAREIYSSATSDYSGGGMPAGLGIVDIIGKRGIGTIGKEILKEDEVDWINILRGVNNTSAVFSKGGGAQIDIFLKALQDQQKGEEVAPIDFLLKAKK